MGIISHTNLLSAADAAKYVKGGAGTFTLKNPKTGNRFTFRLKTAKNGKVIFVSYLSAPEEYTYIGFVRTNWLLVFNPAVNRGFTNESRPCQYAGWLFYALFADVPHLGTAEFWHEGTCGCCGRQLTTPESILSGIGPICAGKRR